MSFLKRFHMVRLAAVALVMAGSGGLVLSAEKGGQATQPADKPVQPGWKVDVVPAYVQESLPAWLEPHLGRFGLPEPYPHWKEPIGTTTRGIDFWQANHFIGYNEKTADYLYHDYSPTTVQYRKGTYPMVEKLVAKYAARARTPREKAIALLTKAMPEAMLHPGIPPYSPACPMDRGLDDEGLIASKRAYCNEQARVYVRMCQAAGIPARMIFLFYADKKGGHVVSEFYADGRWSMADSSYLCVFPAPDGHLMSAAECHQDLEHKHVAGQAYFRRNQEVLRLSDKELVGRKFADVKNSRERRQKIAEKAATTRKELGEQTAGKLGEQFWAFGVENYPLPPAGQ